MSLIKKIPTLLKATLFSTAITTQNAFFFLNAGMGRTVNSFLFTLLRNNFISLFQSIEVENKTLSL